MSALLKVQDLRVVLRQRSRRSTTSASRWAPGRSSPVIGPNGPGKTTSLAAIMGLLPSSGPSTFDGRRSAPRTWRTGHPGPGAGAGAGATCLAR